MSLNPDIWHEIVTYFEYPRDKQTLRSLALTSRYLSDLALDTIWRNGETLLAIVSVINSFAPSPKAPFLVYLPGSKSDWESTESESDRLSVSSTRANGRWVFNKPIPHAARERALEYLARIRNITVAQMEYPSASKPEWPGVLSASLNPHGPLMPNLQNLYIDFITYDHNDYLTPLLSPSIKTLVIESHRRPRLSAILTALNLARVRGCDLEEFAYQGHPVHNIPEAIALFKNLQCVSFPHEYGPKMKSSITIIQFLASLPSLRTFFGNLASFPHSTNDSDQLCHTRLQKIDIQSEPTALHELFRRCKFPSVVFVAITKDGQIPSLKGLESSCPNTRELYLRFDSSAKAVVADRLVEFKHLPLPSSLPIQRFHLVAEEHNLTLSHLHILAKSWPNLRQFRMFAAPWLDPLSILVAFSNHPYLRDLSVGLRLCSLLDNITGLEDLVRAHVTKGGSRPYLRSLFLVWNSGERVVTTAEKRRFVEHLYRLFPCLEELEISRFPSNSLHEAEVAEFREILLELRNEKMEPTEST